MLTTGAFLPAFLPLLMSSCYPAVPGKTQMPETQRFNDIICSLSSKAHERRKEADDINPSLSAEDCIPAQQSSREQILPFSVPSPPAIQAHNGLNDAHIHWVWGQLCFLPSLLTQMMILSENTHSKQTNSEIMFRQIYVHQTSQSKRHIKLTLQQIYSKCRIFDGFCMLKLG